MTSRTEILNKIQGLAAECHQVASSLDIGDERTEMFEIYNILRLLPRNGYAKEVSDAMNPLLINDDFDFDEDDDDDD